MSIGNIDRILSPFVQRGIFPTVEDGVKTLALEHIAAQVDAHQRTIRAMEGKYGMPFEAFAARLRWKTDRLRSEELSLEERAALNREVMLEEDDWLEWKAAVEMLESWLALKDEMQP